jgi:glycosyltransferase involved in cell wall biosynthesis
MTNGTLLPDTITFGIPYYRGLAFLQRAIESVFAQRSSNWRLVIVDDGSDEPAEALVLQYRDPRVRYLHNETTLGMAENWNRCLDLAETDLVTLLHADDELLPNYAALMAAAALEDPDAVAFFCRAKVIDGSGCPIFSFPDRFKDIQAGWSSQPLRLFGATGIARLLRGCFVMCPTVCYRKSRLQDRRFSPRWKMVLDLDFYSRLLADGKVMIGLPTIAYAYRRHATHATAAYNESLLRFQEEAALYDEIANIARKHGWNEVARIGHDKRIVKFHLLFRTFGAIATGRVNAACKRLRLLWKLCSNRNRGVQPCEWR